MSLIQTPLYCKTKHVSHKQCTCQAADITLEVSAKVNIIAVNF